MKRTTLLGMLAVVAVLTCMPMKAAYAYIDPNSAGALYQFLFPLLVAIGSAFAFLRRTIVSAFTRFAHALASVFRGGRRKQPQNAAPPGERVK
jgi:flagellar motor component MotA